MSGDAFLALAVLALVIGLPIWPVVRLARQESGDTVTLRRFETGQAAQAARHALANAGIESTIFDRSARLAPGPANDGRHVYLLDVRRQDAKHAEGYCARPCVGWYRGARLTCAF